MRFSTLFIFGVVILGGVVSRAAAQPVGVTRVMKTIDFEERRYGNDEDLPMHWVKVEGAGFPHYVNGRLTTDRARSGQHSFRFDLNGGSLLYRYEANQIPVQPGATYAVEAWARTTPLEHARARVTGYFVDIDGHPIASSVEHSEAYAAKAADEPWKKLSVRLTASVPQAAYLVIELGLLQPQAYAGNSLGQRTLHPQDIRGSAWFDDLTVAQVPQVTLATDRPGNVFTSKEPAAVAIDVDDALLVDLATQLYVRDGAGRLVHQQSGALDLSSVTTTVGLRKRVRVALPTLEPGWYRVSLSTSSQGQVLGTQTIPIVKLPDDSRGGGMPDERFGLIATDVPFASWPQLPPLVAELGCGRVKLGVWSKSADPDQLDPAAFDNMIARFQNLHIAPTACLLDLPPALARALDESARSMTPDYRPPELSFLRLLKARDEEWQPQLEYLLARHAAHLERWQLGADGSDAFATQKGLRQVYGKVLGKFATLMREPDLAMPWPAWYEMDGNLPATIALSVPSSVLPSQVPLYMQDLKGASGHHLSLSLQLLDRERYGREAQIRDLAQRVIFCLSAGADRIDLPCPFNMERASADDEAPSVPQPQELFVIMRTLLTTLGQTTYRGRVPIAEGVEAFLFERGGQGTIALWDTGRAGAVKPLAINLGASPRMFDLWGNEIPLVRPVDDAATGTVQLAVGPMPTFLTNIDGALARLRASVTLDRPLIESTSQAHARHIKFTNTYSTAITGTMKLVAPTGWTITPSTHNFSLNPGETLDHEVTIEFPMNSPAGSRTIQAEFVVQGERLASFHMPLTVKLGLSQVGMQTLAYRDGKDLVVQQVIQNYGDKAIDYTAFALVPNQQRQERLITNLGAGQSIVKRYRFDGKAVPVGSKARVGIKELDGPRLLNDEVELN